MVNYALLSQQATVLRSRSSPTYFRHGVLEMIQWLLCSKHLFVLRPDSPLIPGYCWPFAGDKGHLHIQLAQNIQITHVTLGHITKTQSPTGETTSAPKHFAVYGKMTLDGTEQLLGRFFYDTGEPGFQTFAISGRKGVSFKHVRLQVESNWGNTEYTCLYNFKVHGTPAPPVGQVTPPQQGQCH
ncbi:SUN domain-containing protein 3-like [Boleophthalmus pectinirostris]|nr:SUN domain-containing protein 3-like [Boleophthalmus pectinirostris]XP_055018986.1 SUN domain-containing protein 3-like [Boleophthalmus pectinirostris]